MKSQDLSAVLKALADMLGAAGARDAQSRIAKFATVFDLSPTTTISVVLKRLNTLPKSGAAGTPNLGDVARLVSSFRAVVTNVSKASFVSVLNSVERLLIERSSIAIDEFVQLAMSHAVGVAPAKRKGRTLELREDLVTSYREALEASVGDDERFSAKHRQLSSDKNIGKGELVALAKRMTGTSPRSKAEALKKIWNMHQELLTFRAKSRATGGRSAA